MLLAITIISFLVSLFLTSYIRKYALAKNVIDIPNARSSHANPTPRGGGVAIVLTFLIGMFVLSAFGYMPFSNVYPLVISGSIVSLVGFLDDHGHIAARWRLLAHFSAAVIFIVSIGGIPAINIWGDLYLELGFIGYILAIFFLVWMLNLYNFMDGIDGIASVEAITSCIGGIILLMILYDLSGFSLVLILGLLVGSVTGFLFWNFPPARIFMGDAGSGFLGFILGALVLQSTWLNPVFLYCWLIMLGVFIVDATWTLLRRLMKGDKVYEAHRSHGYQILSRRLNGHRPVTLAVTVVNVFWLFPIAVWTAYGGINPILALVISYIPLIILVIKLRAGLENN